MLANRKRL